MTRNVLLDFLAPFVVLLGLSALLLLTEADLGLESLFYSPTDGWFLGKSNPWQFIYDYANVPAFAMFLAALVVLIASFLRPAVRRYRKISLFLVLLLALGPGLVVNTVFKDHWGRPRPHEIVNFGGEALYQPFWQKGVGARNGSFPCGHASIGFYLFGPFFFFRKTSRKLALFCLATGIAAGGLVGLARMIQGGHFISDVLWSGGFTYLTGLLLAYGFGFNRSVWYGEDDMRGGSRSGNDLAADCGARVITCPAAGVERAGSRPPRQ